MRILHFGAFILPLLALMPSAQAAPQNTQDQLPPKAPRAADTTATWRPVIESAQPAVLVILTDKGQGSGFLAKSDGTIVTNAHVIAGMSSIQVKLASGEVYRRVYILASDETEDIAILRIEAADVPALPLGNSNEVKPGDNVLLIGAPLGLEETVSTGIISNVTRLLEDGPRVIQTTAPASPGSSGGPLLNTKGEVIGLMSFAVVQGQNLNFAIPINYVRGKLDTLALTNGARLIDSSVASPPGAPAASARKHSGMMLAGLSGPGTPQGSFEFIFVQLLDFLSGKGVDMWDEAANFSPTTSRVVSLNYYLGKLPTSGATGLLYILVEHPYNFKESIEVRCFDASGKLLWEEKESHSGWSETGATNGVLQKIEKKLAPRIGTAGLPLKQDNSPRTKE